MLTKPHKSHDNIYADILKWCFQAGGVRGHMLSVTTVSRQPQASTPPLLSFLRYDRPTEKRSKKWLGGEMEKMRHCGELLEVAAVVRIGEKRGGEKSRR